MKLLIIVIDNPDLVAEIVPVLVELEIRGLVSIEAESVMNFLAKEVPIFAGLRELASTSKSYNRTIFGVSDDEDILDRLNDFLEEIGIDLGDEDAGYAFTVPVEGILGNSSE